MIDATVGIYYHVNLTNILQSSNTLQVKQEIYMILTTMIKYVLTFQPLKVVFDFFLFTFSIVFICNRLL
jgi:hypothetical protein